MGICYLGLVTVAQFLIPKSRRLFSSLLTSSSPDRVIKVAGVRGYEPCHQLIRKGRSRRTWLALGSGLRE